MLFVIALCVTPPLPPATAASQVLPYKLRSRMLQHSFSEVLSRMPALDMLRPDLLIDVVDLLKPLYFVEGGCGWEGAI